MADIGQKIVCNLSATATVRHVVYHNHCTLCVQTSTASSHQAGNMLAPSKAAKNDWQQ